MVWVLVVGKKTSRLPLLLPGFDAPGSDQHNHHHHQNHCKPPSLLVWLSYTKKNPLTDDSISNWRKGMGISFDRQYIFLLPWQLYTYPCKIGWSVSQSLPLLLVNWVRSKLVPQVTKWVRFDVYYHGDFTKPMTLPPPQRPPSCNMFNFWHQSWACWQPGTKPWQVHCSWNSLCGGWVGGGY